MQINHKYTLNQSRLANIAVAVVLHKLCPVMPDPVLGFTPEGRDLYVQLGVGAEGHTFLSRVLLHWSDTQEVATVKISAAIEGLYRMMHTVKRDIAA